MNSELLAILEYIEQERGLNRDILVEALEKAILTASRKSIHPAKDLEVKVDRKSGEIKAWAKLEVVDEEPNNDQILIDEVTAVYPNAKLGDVVQWEVTPENFGRIAAQTAKQAIMQQFRRAEKQIVREEFKDRIGEIVNGIVRRFENGNMIIDLQKAEGVISLKDKIPGEQYRNGDRINAVLLKVDTTGSGPSLILSRTDPLFVRRLFEREVTEIHDGIVEIKGIAREAGSRTKLAVISNDSRVDPIGACVGLRGMRVKNITGELSGERIDIIRYDDDVRVYAANALQPAKPKGIEVDEAKHKLTVHVTPDQARLAFGKRAQNVRLSSKLLGWIFNIIEDTEKVETFEDKIEKTIVSLSEQLDISSEIAEKLVENGFLSIDGLKAATESDLLAIEKLEKDDVTVVLSALEKLK